MNRFYLILIFVLLLSCKEGQRQEALLSQGPYHIHLETLGQTREFFDRTPERIPMVSAHRGGPYPGFPENSIEAFENVLAYTAAIIEFDVAITKDSVLVIMHDNTLDRTTSGSGRVIDHTYEEIRELYLVDNEGKRTQFRVPTLDEVLEWGRGKTVFTVDIKREVPFQMVVEAIQKHQAHPYAVVITYNVAAARKIHAMDPDLMLSLSIRNEEELERHLNAGIPIENWIAFTGTSERSETFNRKLHEKGVFTILGVIGNLDKRAEARGDSTYLPYIKRGADILATDRPIEAARAIKGLIPKSSKNLKFLVSQ